MNGCGAGIRLALAALAWLAAACGGASQHYRDIVQAYGLHRALHHEVLADGQLVELHASDPEGRPVEGVVLSIHAETGTLRFRSDSSGRVVLPISRALLAENPPLEIERPAGVQLWMNFSLERACDASTRVEHASAIGNVEAWPHVDLGLDRVYTQPGTSGAHSDAAAAYLRVGRELFFSLTGSPPPAIAIAFVRDRNLGGTQDAGGREVWPVNESQLEDDEGLLVVIHEWTHAVFAQSLRFTGNSSSRYLEDGVCETVSHLVYARVHGTQRSPVAKTRAAELARAREPAFDLVSLDGRIASSTGATLFDQLASICSNSLITIGYGLGMALWLERLDADPQALSSLFAQLRARGQPRADDLIELAEQAAGKDGVRRASVARALTILRAHASGAD